MYKVNKLDAQDMVENLTILLHEDKDSDNAMVFPCEDEIMEMIASLRNDTTVLQQLNRWNQLFHCSLLSQLLLCGTNEIGKSGISGFM